MGLLHVAVIGEPAKLESAGPDGRCPGELSHLASVFFCLLPVIPSIKHEATAAFNDLVDQTGRGISSFFR